MKQTRKEMIESIAKRYYALNDQDYAEGRIDLDVKEGCDACVPAFKELLEKLSDADILTFFRLDKATQHQVFSWDSAATIAVNGYPQEWVKGILSAIKDTLESTGLGGIPVIKTITGWYIEALENLANADYEELPNGAAIYRLKK